MSTDGPVRRRGPGSRADAAHPTRLELLDAAIELAEEVGLAELSVAAVTRRAGHAKGTFYVHFPDRSSMLVALHRRFHDRLFAEIERETAALTPGPERAARRLLAFLDGCRRLPGVRALLLDARVDPAIGGAMDERNELAARLLAADLAGRSAHPRELGRIAVVAAADVAARESRAGRRLPAARAALVELVGGHD
jgi:AcrR family transcriptional regulator